MSQFAELPDHRAQRPHGVPVSDFVGTIDDALALGKNVAVMRGFAAAPARMEMAKLALKKDEKKWTIDMWPLSVNPGSIVQHTYEAPLPFVNSNVIVKKLLCAAPTHFSNANATHACC
jgi:hypothetical protein